MKIWVRLGITMDISDEDYATLTGEDRKSANEKFRQLIRGGKFIPDGEAYIPAEFGDRDVVFDV